MLNNFPISFLERVSDLNTPVMKAMQIFYLENIPESQEDLSIYGEEDLNTLSKFFLQKLERAGCKVDQLHKEWITLKLHMHKRRGSENSVFYKNVFTGILKEKLTNILMLAEIILVIPTSSAICERGFSTMARIKTDGRSRLGPEMLDNLMAISVNGPTIADYNCNGALSLWFNGEKKRRPMYNSVNIVDFHAED